MYKMELVMLLLHVCVHIHLFVGCHEFMDDVHVCRKEIRKTSLVYIFPATVCFLFETWTSTYLDLFKKTKLAVE